MSDALLTLLRWCLLGLVYLFFLRVLQVTWATTTPRRRPSAASTPRAPVATPVAVPELVVVEPAELVGRRWAVDTPVTLGRAAGCEITLDDTYVSQVHARVGRGEHGVVVEDLGSTNGTYLNRRRVTAPVVVRPGDLIQVGSTVLELR